MDENETPIQAAEEVKTPAKARTTARKTRATKATGSDAATAAPAKKAKTTRTRKAAKAVEPAEAPATETAPTAAPQAPVVPPAAAPMEPAAPTQEPAPTPQPPTEASQESTRPVRTRDTRNRQPKAAPANTEPVEDMPREPQRDAAPTRDIAPGFAAPETVGGNEGNGNNRRKRRRRNRRGNGDAPNFTAAPNARIDADELVRRAWKIYLGEVTEEGLALMDDRTAAEASRRAFRVAELFLQEAARHRQAATPAPQPETGEDDEESGEE